jgi:hypothetical protein
VPDKKDVLFFPIECFHPSQIQTKPNLTRQPSVIGFGSAGCKKAWRLVERHAKESCCDLLQVIKKSTKENPRKI